MEDVCRDDLELLNLCNCHGCGVQNNCTNPREKLQPMDSMWRIVLLCNKCSMLVNTSDLCSYCFSSLDDKDDCFKCQDCQHSIHKECVARCGSGGSVCVDCWVPAAFVNSVRARKRKVRKRNNECGEWADTDTNTNTDTLFEVRVSVGEFSELNSVDKEVERKVAAAVKATENAVRKAVAAKNAVELAKGVLSVVAGRKGCEMEVGDDAKLAVLLRRAINSSPRISRYACLGSSFRRDGVSVACYSRRRAGRGTDSTSDGPLFCYSRRRGKGCFRNSVSLNEPLMCYSRRRSCSKAGSHGKKTDENVSIPSAGLKDCNRGSDSENRYIGNNGQRNDVGRLAMMPHRSLLKYYRIGKGTPRPLFFVKDSDSPNINSASLSTEGMTGSRNFGNDYECHDFCEKFDDNANRFLLKYRRRLRSKPVFNCKISEFSSTLSDARPFSSSQGQL